MADEKFGVEVKEVHRMEEDIQVFKYNRLKDVQIYSQWMTSDNDTAKNSNIFICKGAKSSSWPSELKLKLKWIKPKKEGRKCVTLNKIILQAKGMCGLKEEMKEKKDVYGGR